MSYTPQVNAQTLELYLGLCATGVATSGSHSLTNVAFGTVYFPRPSITFEPSDVGMPIAIVGAGAVNPLMPPPYFVQGSMLVTTIASYVSPTEVMLTDAPTTSIANTGFATIILYRPCPFASDVASGCPTPFQFSSSIAPGTRDTLQFSILNSLGGVDNPYIDRFGSIQLGQPVYLRSTDGAVGDIFGGYIDTLTVSTYPGVTEPFSWSATCASWAGLATRRAVPPAIPQVFTDMPGDQVFAQLVLDYLSDDGVAVTAASAPNITLAAPVGATISQLLDQLVGLISTPDVSWYWYTDPWRTFILTTRTATAAPWDVTDGSDLFVGDTPYQQSIQSTHNQMANQVYGLGTNTLLNGLPTTFHGDGTATTFNLALPCGSAPAIELNSVAQTVGVLGIDTGVQWYWAQGSTTITQATGGTVLTPSDTLVVTYQTETPAVSQAPNAGSLQALQAIEGTSAEYDYTFTVAQPILPADLYALANAYQNEYGSPAQTVTFYTLRPGLKTGQLQSIALADAQISGTFLIATVQMTIMNNVIVWQYTAFGGANIGDAITALTQFINRGQNTLAIVTPTKPIQVALHEITIDHTKVVGGDKTNFVFCFHGTYGFLTGPPLGNVAYADGSDIFFSSDSEGADVMSFDLEFYDPASGEITAWIRIPTLSHTVDTVIYINYGDPSVSSSLADPATTWSSVPEVSGAPNANYRGVYHLAESTGPYHDSTQYDNTSTGSLGTGYPAPATGPFGFAVNCPSSSYEGIAIPNSLVGDGLNNFDATIECYLNTTTGPGFSGQFMDAFDAQANTGTPWGLAIAEAFGGFAALIYSINGTFYKLTSSILIDDGNWHYLVATMDQTNAYLYVDGVLAITAGAGNNEAMFGTNPLEINGNRGGLSIVTYVGLIAECRVNQAALDANTVATNSASQQSPSTFYSLGESQTGPPPQTTPVLGNPQGTVTHATGALTSNLPVFGNAGADIKVGTKTGNTEQMQCASGSAGATDSMVRFDANGNAIGGSAVVDDGTEVYVTSRNVGIGTTTPDAPLVVSTSADNTPAAYVSTSVSGGGLGIYNTNANAASRNWGVVGNFISYGDFAIAQSAAQGGNPFYDSSTPKLYINSSGDVGVGTTSPAYALDVNGDINTSGQYRVNGVPFSGGGGSSAGVTIYSGQAQGTGAPYGTQYFPLGGGAPAAGVDTTNGCVMETAGVLSNFSASLSVPLGVGCSVTFTLWQNFAGTAITCTISGFSATTGSDNTHSISYAPGDNLQIQAVFSGSIAVIPIFTFTTAGGPAGLSVTTKGDLQGYDTGPNRVPVGSDGQVLTADSTQTLGLKWAAAGALVLLEEHTASSSAALDFTSWYSSAYDEYAIEFVNVVTATASDGLGLQMSTNGGSSYDSGANYTGELGFTYSGGLGNASYGGLTLMQLIAGLNLASTGSMCGSFRMYGPAAGASLSVTLQGTYGFLSSGAGHLACFWSGVYASSGAVNAFRVLAAASNAPSGRNIASGTVRVYGLTH